MKFKNLIVILFSLAISGCATSLKQADRKLSPPLHDIRSSAPANPEPRSPAPALKERTGRIYFYRTANLFGAALQPSIMLDGKKVGDSKPGGFFFIDSTPGNHEVIIGNEVSNPLTFILNNHETKYIKTSVGAGSLMGRIIPERVSASEAQKELPNLSLTGNR